MDQAAEVGWLRLMAAADEDPKLDDDALTLIIRRARVVDRTGNLATNVASALDHTTNTTVVAGAVRQQPSTNRWWRALNPGTTAAEAPSWPTFTTQPPTGIVVGDGTVRWEDVGGAWADTFDTNLALALCWEAKAAKASCRINFTADGQSFQRAQVAARCMEMARAWRNRRAGTLVTSC